MSKTQKIAVFIAILGAFLSPISLCAQQADFHVVPLPHHIQETSEGNFTINAQTLVCIPQSTPSMRRNAGFLVQYIEKATGLKLKLSPAATRQNCIVLMEKRENDANAEKYAIRVNKNSILIEGATGAGVFYGVQTLRKALPMVKAQQVVVPAVTITDYPRFAYRGAHLDVARHFVTPDSIYRFIDMLALHNINRFHWHLTDDQGWRIEIKKYPRLTEVGSKRAQTVIGNNTGKYDEKPYGGFYTQEELRHIVRYAAERYITIVPEIDLPGHMQAALAAYPELGCTGGPYKVWEKWGVSDNVLCAGNAKTYEFIDNVLDEVAQIFPSKYIHVGGDECPKTQWAKCEKCQTRIRLEGLQAENGHTAEERLQSYVIKHAEAHLATLGRSMIGWDETLEGGLAPNATVMSWRGEGGGIEAARQGHDVIMTPNTHLYFDYYQSTDKASEPEAIGGYIPLETVFNYNPVPKQLSAEEQKHIIGVQANLWTEYIKTYRQAEYMELPRMAALCEVQWNNDEMRNYRDFIDRLQRMIKIYTAENYNFSRVIYNPRMLLRADNKEHVIRAGFTTIDNAPIHYTLDGSEPTEKSPLFKTALVINKNCRLRAAAFRPEWGKTPEVSEDFSFSKATACPITLLQKPHPRQVYGGANLLVDGLKATDTNYASGRWIGFCGNDLEAVIDLGQKQPISSVNIRTCVEKGYWLFDARSFEVLGSVDGKTYQSLAKEEYPAMTEANPNQIYAHSLKFGKAQVRYVKVRVAAERSIPQWHPGHGAPGFVFVDEIEVF